jgi:hypothetical protein
MSDALLTGKMATVGRFPPGPSYQTASMAPRPASSAGRKSVWMPSSHSTLIMGWSDSRAQ